MPPSPHCALRWRQDPPYRWLESYFLQSGAKEAPETGVEFHPLRNQLLTSPDILISKLLHLSKRALKQSFPRIVWSTFAARAGSQRRNDRGWRCFQRRDPTNWPRSRPDRRLSASVG